MIIHLFFLSDHEVLLSEQQQKNIRTKYSNKEKHINVIHNSNYRRKNIN